MDAAYKRLEVTAGCDMDSWSSSVDSVAMPVSSLGISFEGNDLRAVTVGVDIQKDGCSFDIREIR